MSNQHKTYPLNQSPLYKLLSKRRLALLLPTGSSNLKNLSNVERQYSCWNAAKKNGGFRRIEAPHDNLKAIQKRLAVLLGRITPPDYLMAPVKGRSYVDNAAFHRGSRAYCLLDLEDFFPSCTQKRVYWFFNKVMRCSDDVAAILANLTTVNEHLPQGSPCSPILAYWAYTDMWNSMNSVFQRSNCRLSVYADDITISGDQIYGRDIWEAKKILHQYGHSYNCGKEYRVIDKPVRITGAIVSGSKLLLPNKQHKKLSELKKLKSLKKQNGSEKLLDRQIRGREAQARQILDY